jgi:iron complex transport system ATP-binding protein
MPTSGEILLLGHRYGESDWRDLRQRVGLVSSSVRQMMADDEPALETVVSGRYAMIDLWGRATRTDRVRASVPSDRRSNWALFRAHMIAWSTGLVT